MATPAADENGNVWEDQAVPGGREIAEVMLEIRGARGWQDMWSDCDGLRICPRVRVWLDGYQDHDYEEVFLLRVWTDSEVYEDWRTLTLTDHLAVFSRSDGVDVEWRNDPRLFFDAGIEWGYDGLRWWVDWAQAVTEARNAAFEADRPMPQSVLDHNRAVSERDRTQALKMGLAGALPYLKH